MSELNKRAEDSHYDSLPTEELQEILRKHAHGELETEPDTDELYYMMEVLAQRKEMNDPQAIRSDEGDKKAKKADKVAAKKAKAAEKAEAKKAKAADKKVAKAEKAEAKKAKKADKVAAKKAKKAEQKVAKSEKEAIKKAKAADKAVAVSADDFDDED